MRGASIPEELRRLHAKNRGPSVLLHAADRIEQLEEEVRNLDAALSKTANKASRYRRTALEALAPRKRK